MSINQRITEIINVMFAGNKRAFSTHVGINPAVIENIVGKRQSNPSFEVTNKILLSNDNISADWLMVGAGSMLKPDKKYQIEETTHVVHDLPFGYDNVESQILYSKPKPFVDFAYAKCGEGDGFDMAFMEHDCQRLVLPFIVDFDFSIRARGDSMINRRNPSRSIREGDVIALKVWQESYIRWGDVYALATNAGVIVKQVRQPNNDESCIQCVSYNVEDGHAPFHLPISDIHSWAVVVGIASVKMW